MKPQILMKMMALIFTVITTTANAADFCATNSINLATALKAAENNNEADTIRIKKGTYLTLPGGFEYSTDQDDDIEISGGWVSLLNDPCNFQLPNSPSETILDGNSQNRVMYISVNTGDTKIKISGLSFINGEGNTGSDGSGLTISATQLSSNAEVILDNNEFINNSNESKSALNLITSAGKTLIRNNLFAYNNSDLSSNVEIRTVGSSPKLYLINNTIFGNSGRGASIIHQNDSSQTLIANNIFWDNDFSDLFLLGEGSRFLRRNNIGIQTGGPADEQFGNISEPPHFEAGSMNFKPAYYSAMVGGGINPPIMIVPPIPFEWDWDITEFDLEGNDRWQGKVIDIGAIESNHSFQQTEFPIFATGFEQKAK
ncbi:right-handed parallel beta-helix repeat-containing protein [Marinicella sp. W31]|uniref:right-handed parallel beta-helix repeat-containing protein n=1 Tax=Marinicella sp. W31 TaxID=3023713 RepID=UPI0037565125